MKYVAPWSCRQDPCEVLTGFLYASTLAETPVEFQIARRFQNPYTSPKLYVFKLASCASNDGLCGVDKGL
jgi:hypothetical protein